ncbi:transposon Ty3-I Gag-Pol polyprotein [Trichonephila clavipes]|nr:transposon Ty3-I Gag-Pol polyprotein [Trichonephila clavipes]
METDQTPPNAEDLKTCSRILDVFEYQLIKKTRLTYNQQILFTMDNGLVRKNQESYDLIERENGKLMEEIQDIEGNEDSKIRTLLQGLELGNARPSQLLTRMRSLAGDSVGELRLPNGPQTILAALNGNLYQLSTVADKINDLAFFQGINSVAATSKKIVQLEQQIAQLTQQRHMHQVLAHLEFCIPYFDDLLVTSSSEDEHLDHLHQIFSRLRDYGLKALSVERFQHFHVDLIGPFPPSHGFTFLLTFIDRYIRWPEVIPVSDISPEVVTKVSSLTGYRASLYLSSKPQTKEVSSSLVFYTS